MNRATFDFETEAIDQRPKYPPKPTGVAIGLPGMKKRYYSWGHPTKNGIWELRGKKVVLVEGDPKKRGVEALRAAYKCDTILGHNSSKFDVDVAETHLGVKPPKWDRLDDSLFTRFLVDPHAHTLSLKPSCERVLGIEPEARNEVYWWLANHGHINKPKMEHGKEKWQKNAGAMISKAPGDLVGRYAIDDLVLSEQLFDHDMKIVKRDGMLEAYRREQRVAPILLANERMGMRVDLPLLEADKKTYDAALAKVEVWLR